MSSIRMRLDYKTATLGLVVIAMFLPMRQNDAKATTIFTSNLTGLQETPPNASPASGSGTFTLNEARTDLSFNVTYTGLTGGSITGTHFHVAPLDVAGPIVRGLDIGSATSPNGTFAGVWRSTDAQALTPVLVNALFDNNIYFNIHTQVFPAGEIRGQLVPEPATGLLLAAGLVGMALWRKRAR